MRSSGPKFALEPADLPDGAKVELLLLDAAADMEVDEQAALEASIRRGLEEADRGACCTPSTKWSRVLAGSDAGTADVGWCRFSGAGAERGSRVVRYSTSRSVWWFFSLLVSVVAACGGGSSGGAGGNGGSSTASGGAAGNSAKGGSSGQGGAGGQTGGGTGGSAGRGHVGSSAGGGSTGTAGAAGSGAAARAEPPDTLSGAGAGSSGVASGHAGGSGGGVTPGVTPPLSGLALWLRADTGITKSGSNATVWADTLSGGGVSMAVTGTCPFVANSFNGKPGITMSPNNYFGVNSNVLPTGAKTVIIVAKLSTPTGGALWSSRGSSALFIAGPIGVVGDFVFSFSNGAQNAEYVNTPMFPGQTLAYGFRTDGTASQVLLSLNGVDVATAGQTYTAETGSAGTFVGRHATSATNSATGDYLEVLAWSRELTTQELTTTQAYISSRYGSQLVPMMGLSPKITLAGDSITAGYNAGTSSLDSTYSWTVELQASLIAKYTAANLTVPVFTNTAVVGQTTSGMLTNINTQLLATKMTDLIIMIGINDVYQAVPYSTTISNMTSIFSQIHSAYPSCHVWLVTPPFISAENWPNGTNAYDLQLDTRTLAIVSALIPYLGSTATVLDIKALAMAYEAANNGGHATNGILTQGDGIHPSKPLGQTQMSGRAYGMIKTIAD
jgi:lysophospholipase L1-like esterase